MGDRGSNVARVPVFAAKVMELFIATRGAPVVMVLIPKRQWLLIGAPGQQLMCFTSFDKAVAEAGPIPAITHYRRLLCGLPDRMDHRA